MRMRRSSVAALILLVVGLAGLPAAAQEPGMVRVITTHVQLGHQQHLESLIPKLWAAMKKAGAASPIFVSAGISDPSAYTFVVPMASFADIAAQEAAFGKAFAADASLTGEIFGMTTSIDDEIWTARPDLSYVPASPRMKMEEQGFARMALLYALPGQTEALEAVLKERSALRKKHGIADGSNVVQMILGADGPVYGILVGAKDEADFYAQNAKNNEKMGAEWQASLEKSGPMLRRVEFVTFAARPALSYMP